MVTPMPMRVRALPSGRAVVVGDDGRFFEAGAGYVERLANASLTCRDTDFLVEEGFADDGNTFRRLVHDWRVAKRRAAPTTLDYLILVPTLRCNLACGYCQVSRVNASQAGFDWTEETLAAVLGLIDGLMTTTIKIEFQGGEPTLRPDLIRSVMRRCERFAERQFVICTNLSRLDDELLSILDDPHVVVSTSLDGDDETHERQRTRSGGTQASFTANLAAVIERYGVGKVSALPTVDPERPPEPDTLIDAYASRGLRDIFLRPITYHGFARKRHAAAVDPGVAWRAYYERFIRRIIERNWADREVFLTESYLAVCLARIMRPGVDRHVDLREPNPVGVDYVVVDHDGRVYPTDEARMLTRSRVIDLSIGTVADGWDTEARRAMHAHSTNADDPDCKRCAYQPFCGRDLIDDIARYGTIDRPRHETEFCRRHTHAFDLAFELLLSDDPADAYSVSRWLGGHGAIDRLVAVAPS